MSATLRGAHRALAHVARFGLALNCPYCGCRMERTANPYVGRAVTTDHILPRHWGGEDSDDNFRAVCKHCNELRSECGHCIGAMACVMAVTTRRDSRWLARRWFPWARSVEVSA